MTSGCGFNQIDQSPGVRCTRRLAMLFTAEVSQDTQRLRPPPAYMGCKISACPRVSALGSEQFVRSCKTHSERTLYGLAREIAPTRSPCMVNGCEPAEEFRYWSRGIRTVSKKLHVATLAVAVTVFMSACDDEGYESSVIPPSSQSLTQVVAFGDSLSDAGTYNPTTADANPDNDIPSGLTFSTKPGMTWAAYVAISFGHTLTPNQQVNFGIVGNGGEVLELGGLSYAEGGARIEMDAPNGGVVMQTIPNVGTVPVQLATSRSINTQIDDYLAEHGNAFDEQTLVLIQGGANDFFAFLGAVAANPALANTAPAVISAAATAMVNQVGRLNAAGATRIIYSNLPDLGITPQFRTTPLAGLATQLSLAYNAAVANALNGLGVDVFDTATLIQQVAASPSTYGFTNATTPACNSFTTPGNPATLSALICFPTTLVAPGADLTYVFADGVHPTAGAHALWGDQVIAAFPSP